MAENKVKEVTAKCNIKYDKDLYVAGESFKVRKSDLKELVAREFVEAIEEESENGDYENTGELTELSTEN